MVRAGYKKYHKKKEKMNIKNIKLVLLLAVLYVSLPSLSWTEESCRFVFNEISEKLKKVDINQYKAQEGYVRLTEEFKDTTNMADIFDKVFEILDKKQMRVLRWKKFQGTVSEFYKLKDKILHDDNSIRREHQGLGGFLKLVRQYFSNDFLKAYRNVSSVLDKDQMIELGWQKFKKTILNFNRFAKPLLNKDASIKDEYKGREGYIRFVEDLEGTASMDYVFSKVSKVLDTVKMKELQWQQFQGTSVDFKNLKELLSLDVIEEYKGSDGYVNFTKKYFEGDMEKAYKNVSAVLGGGDSRLMKQLDWQKYHGLVSDFNKIRDKILNKDGSIKEEYKGMDGYVKFAKEHFEGNMEKSYKNVSAVLGGGSRLMKQLDWQTYQGLVSEFNKLRNKILNKDGSIKEKYKGSDGYVNFAKKYFEGNMQKAYINVSSVLGGGSRLMKQLDWQAYQGSVSEFNKLRNKILNKDGSIREEYKGMDGYIKFAKEHFKGNMQKSYKNVSAVLGGGGSRLMKQLDWQKYQGLVSDFNKIRDKILNKDGSIKEEYKGSDGYVNFSKEHFESDMQKAYQNVSAVLGGRGSRLMKQLDWQKYHGLVSDFNKIRDKILNKDGSIKEEYKGSDGYVNFSKKYFEGNMQKTYQNVSSVLGGGSRLMKQLDWQAYHGLVSDFNELRSQILNEDGSIREEYKGMDGYVKFAKEHFEGNMEKAYKNVSAVLGGGDMKQLDWKKYQGSVSDFNKIRDKILNKDGSIKEEYKGMDGYIKFAKEHFEGNMEKTYKNVSVVLGGVLEMRRLNIGWKRFQGTVDQFKDLKELFENNKREDLEGEQGQSRVAREIFKGNKRKAYDMVSALREELLGSIEAFKELGWKK